MRRRLVAAVALVASVSVGCSSTGEPGHTAAIDAVRVDADGLTQTVVPAGDGFDRVTVTTATFGAPDGVDGVLEVVVAGAGEERRAAAAGSDIPDNGPVTFAFRPFPRSAGRTFTLTFTYTGEQPVALYRNPFDPYPDGELAPADGDLVFALGHADRVGGAVAALGRVARDTAAVARADPVFLVLWLVAIAAVAVGGLRLRSGDARRRRGGASP